MDSLWSQTVHGILQARTLEWVASLFFSRGSSQPRNRTRVSHIVSGFFTNWAIREALIYITSVQFSSVAQLCPTLCDAMNCTTGLLSITNSRSLLKLMSIESVMPSNHLILRLPLLLPLSINCQHSCLENSLNRGAWQATVHGATKSQTWLSD